MYGKYLFLKTQTIRELGLEIILHPYLTRRALLNISKSRKPNPPCCLGWQIFSHEIKWIFLSFSRWPHQNYETILLISLQSLVGNKKQDITGMVVVIALIKTFLHFWDKSFSFHPATLFWILSLTKAKAWDFDGLIKACRLQNLS